VTHDLNGLLFDAGNASSLANALRRLTDSPEVLERLAAAAPPVKPLEQDVLEWEWTYEQLRLESTSIAAL
jgi:hypothetical protein